MSNVKEQKFQFKATALFTAANIAFLLNMNDDQIFKKWS